jgi:hypothetical protein
MLRANPDDLAQSVVTIPEARGGKKRLAIKVLYP